ncbi:hypothetical protein ACFL5Z_04300 [Planctomycetota bacterium]
MDCETVQVRANFDTQLNLKKEEIGKALKDKDWDIFFDEGIDTVPGDGSYYELTVCVKASKVKKVKGPTGTKVVIGTVTITCEVPDGGYIELRDCAKKKLDLYPIDCGDIGLKATKSTEDIHNADFNALVVLTEKWLEIQPGISD